MKAKILLNERFLMLTLFIFLSLVLSGGGNAEEPYKILNKIAGGSDFDISQSISAGSNDNINVPKYISYPYYVNPTSVLYYGVWAINFFDINVSSYRPNYVSLQYCFNCSDCENKINNAASGETVKLNHSITQSVDSTCILWLNNNITFDCQGNEITFTGTDNTDLAGISFGGDNSDHNTIKNCKIEGFDAGIYIKKGDNNTLQNNELKENNVGIYMWNADDNSLENNLACNNSNIDIKLAGGSGTGDNNTCDTISNWNDSGTLGCTYTCPGGRQTYICFNCSDCENKINNAASGETVKLNHSITQSVDSTCIFCLNNNITFDCQGNEITFTGTDNTDLAGVSFGGDNSDHNTIKNCKIKGFDAGIFIKKGDNNTLHNNELKENSIGVYMVNASDNRLENNTACNNSNMDIKRVGGSGTGDNNTCDGADKWNDTGTVGCTSACPVCSLQNYTTCFNCSDCSEKLTGCYSVVVLNNSIYNQTGNCITFNANNAVFDCQGNFIDGDGIGYYDEGPPWEGGIYMTSKQNNTIRNCVITEFDKGLYIINSSHNVFENNTLTLNAEQGISLSDWSNYNNITNNTLFNNGRGIRLAHSSFCIISDNYVCNNNLTMYGMDLENYGIRLRDNSHDNIVLNNIVNSNNYGVHLWFGYQNESEPTYNNLIINNTINNNNLFGVSIKSSNNTIIGNTINNNGKFGIAISRNASNNNISNNIIDNNTKYGIYITDNSTDNSIFENEVCFNTDYDFYIFDSPGNLGDDNTCDEPDGWNDTGTDGCTYSCAASPQNTCFNCSDCENKINNTAFGNVVKLDHNIVQSVDSTCILWQNNNITFDCQGNEITFTGANNTNLSGIRLSGENSDHNTIKNCKINDFYTGISIEKGNDNTLQNNELRENNFGIYIFLNANNNELNGNIVCNNSNMDIKRVGESGTGDNNTCGNANNWNDTGTVGCTYTCSTGPQNYTTCFNCSDCSEKLTGGYGIVVLNSSIYNQTDTCITFNGNNVVFDCQGNVINGDSIGDDSGIRLYNSSGNVIKNCVITDFHNGVVLYYSPNNTLINNTANSNVGGIYLYYSPNNTLKNNTMNNNTYNFNIVHLVGPEPQISNDYQDIDISNTVDGRPIYYWTNEKNAPNNCKNLEVPQGAGFVALVSCSNITVKNLNLYNNSHGILLVNTTNSNILNNTANSNYRVGIHLMFSSNNTMINSTANSNWEGIGVWYSSSNNTMINNTANSNDYGIDVWIYSSNNTLINNTANSNDYCGIDVWGHSSNNTLINNTANSNKKWGVLLYAFAINNTLINNTANSNNWSGICLYSSSNNNIINNTVNSNNWGIHLYYNSSFNNILNNNILNNSQGLTISNCGYVAIPFEHGYYWGCDVGNTNNILQGNEILNNNIGVYSNSSSSIINSNFVCNDIELDFNSSGWLSSSGDNNTCDEPDGWNDTGTVGCTYTCSTGPQNHTTCFNCSDCSEKLTGDYRIVVLNNSIYNQTGACITFNANNVSFDCQGNVIDGNGIGEDSGIYLYNNSWNTIENCVITGFRWGIHLSHSSYNTLINNTMSNNTYNFNIYSYDTSSFDDISQYYQDIDTSNTVDGRPIYYWTNEKNAPNNCKNVEVPQDAGLVGLISCDNITVKNQDLHKNNIGILLVNTTNSNILNNTLNSNWLGILLLSYSSNNIIINNNASSNWEGIGLWYSSLNNILINNTANSNNWGIDAWINANNNILINNTANSNVFCGIDAWRSKNNSLINNTANSNNFGIFLFGFLFNDSDNNILINNTANSNDKSGIQLQSSSNNNIINNTANSNDYGIYLFYGSSFNNISNNKILDNTKGVTTSNCGYVIKERKVQWECHPGNTNNTLQGNEILNNNIGIHSNSSSSIINSNFVCNNIELDFNSSGWLSSSGDNNACDKPDGWSDDGKMVCSLTCQQYWCDLNYDGIYIHDWNDLMLAYKCFLGINKKCKINYHSWNLMKQEYQCFANN